MARPEARAELCALREGTARQQPEVEAARARAQASPAPEWARGSAPAGPAAAAATAAAAAGDGGVPLSAVVAVEVERAVAVMSGAETELSGVAMMTATEAEEVVAAGEGAAAAEGGSAAEAEAAVMGEDAGGSGGWLCQYFVQLSESAAAWPRACLAARQVGSRYLALEQTPGFGAGMGMCRSSLPKWRAATYSQ